ncbi:MAG TPA: ATP-binding SpoIIE family protein phosphatase [Mycobacteriales bacterium]|nr:ATP-binding SpoIIE family protein phosphatase [Mycobacteriales bacterium]
MTGPTVAVHTAAMSFAPDPEAPGLARRFVGNVLAGRLPESTIDVARLLVSELVTNAVVHAASAVEVEVTLDDAGAAVRVRDADTGPLVSRGGGTELDEGGRGFMLVDRLAHTWGTEHSGGRKTVWFRLLLDDEQLPPPPAPVSRDLIDESPLRHARRMLRTLVIQPHVQATLTLREQLRELLARIVDTVSARGASIELTGDTDPITTGVLDAATTSYVLELVVDDRRLGHLTVALDDAVSDEDDAFLRLASDRLALLAVEAGMIRAEHGRGSDHDFLAETTELLSGSTSVALSLAMLTQIAVPRLAEWCAALSVDDRGRPRRLTVNHRREERTEAVHQALDSDRELRQSILAAAAGDGPQRLTATVSVGGQRSHVVVLPLVSRLRILGILVLGGPDQLDPMTYMAAVELARRAGLAVENARLHEEQAATVAALQASLLPAALPEVPGLELAARYHSASPGMSVGGDFYDAVLLDDGALVLAIGDVCGKGAEAAAVTGMSRDLLRLLIEDGTQTIPALRRLNRALLAYPASSRFCTIALARLERDGDRLTARLSLGGHPEPVLLHADGRTELVGAAGDLLGVLEQGEFELHETEVNLDPGDALVLYTDGVTERRDGQRMFGQYGLRKTLASSPGATAEALASALERAAESFVDTELRDDLAILVIRRVS